MKQTRRKNALVRLEKQLVSGVKPITKISIMRTPSEQAIPKTEPLTEHDVKRIKKEIATLKERI